MARANERPTIDLQAGLAAFEEDLPRVLRVLDAPSIEALGWTRPNAISLLVPMMGTFNQKVDHFTLRLGFQAYRTWPPSALFVNPSTGAYSYPDDQQHVPKLTSPECYTHIGYQRVPTDAKRQLICCSATFEFYDVLHPVDAQFLWRDTNTFLTTLQAIQRAMASFYQGRFP